MGAKHFMLGGAGRQLTPVTGLVGQKLSSVLGQWAGQPARIGMVRSALATRRMPLQRGSLSASIIPFPTRTNDSTTLPCSYGQGDWYGWGSKGGRHARREDTVLFRPVAHRSLLRGSVVVMGPWEYVNSVLPLGASEEKMNERVAEYEAKGYTLCGTYALDTGNIVIRFKRPKYGQGKVT